MSLDATRWAWQQQLRASAKLVLLSLADRADENHRCYPSITRLKSDTGLHSETISDAIKELESLRLIVVQRITGQGNVYRLLGVENRHHHPGKAGYQEKPGYPEKAWGTTPEKQGTTTPENRGMNLSVEPTKNLPGNLSGKTPDDDPPELGKRKPNNRDLRQQAREILDFLNTKTGRNYQPVDANLDMIVARLKEGFSKIQLKQVVAKKCRDWQGDEKMDQYLRPATLFNRKNFANYSGELVAPKESAHEAES